MQAQYWVARDRAAAAMAAEQAAARTIAALDPTTPAWAVANDALQSAARDRAQATHWESVRRTTLRTAHEEAAGSPPTTRRLRFLHTTVKGGQVAFTIADESEGTIRLLQIADEVASDTRSGGVLVYDEVERSLHPLLARFLLSAAISSPGDEPWQILFATHAAELLDADLVPPAGTWFVEKDHTGASRLHSLADFKPEQLARLRGRLATGYLNGRFGGIPIIDDDITKLAGNEADP